MYTMLDGMTAMVSSMMVFIFGKERCNEMYHIYVYIMDVSYICIYYGCIIYMYIL